MLTPDPRRDDDQNHAWVLAAPFRAHVRQIQAVTTLPWAALAAHAGVSPTLVHHLVFGRRGRPVRRISRETAVRLLALTSADLAALSGSWVATAVTADRLRVLLAGGCNVDSLAAWCRLTPSALLALEDAPRCSRFTELLVYAACLVHPRLFEPDAADAAA